MHYKSITSNYLSFRQLFLEKNQGKSIDFYQIYGFKEQKKRKVREISTDSYENSSRIGITLLFYKKHPITDITNYKHNQSSFNQSVGYSKSFD